MAQVLFASFLISILTALMSIIISLIDSVVNNYGEIAIDINEGKKILNVKGGSPLLFSLAEQKIFIPSACGGKATCGECKVCVKSDVGQPLPTELPLLSSEQLKNNIRLSCQVKLKKDIKIQIPEALFEVSKYACEVEAIEDLTYDIKRVGFRIKDGQKINYKAGQYVQLVIPKYDWKKVIHKVGEERAAQLRKLAVEHNQRMGNNTKIGFPAHLLKGEVVNPETVQRAYSMSSDPKDDQYIEVLVRLVPGGVASTYVHTLLNVKERMEIVGPFGEFYVRDTQVPMVWVAGGSGLAPFKSIIYDLLEQPNPSQRPIWFLFGARTQADLYYVNELREFERKYPHFRYIPALSNEPEIPQEGYSQWTGERGLITEVLEKYLKTLDIQNGAEGYLCGSPGMINACNTVFQKYHIKDLYYDSFT